MIPKKIFKKTFLILCVCALLAGLCLPMAGAAEIVELVSPCAIVTELTSGSTLLSSQPDKEIDPGSVAKVISLYVLCSECFKGNADLRDRITITAEMLQTESSVIPVREGEEFKYEDLLYLMFMDYSETAAYAAAEYAAGSAENLVKEMNAFADSCGCENTLFTNITGAYDGQQHTTPADLVRMLETAVENTVFCTVLSAKSYTVDETNKSISRTLTTSNQLQRSGSSYYCPECTGGRFGGIGEGYTTISVSVDENSGMELIVIVSGATTQADSYSDASKLIRWTFDGFSWRTVLSADENIAAVPVDMGRDTDHVIAVPANDVTIMLDNEIEVEDFEREIDIYSGDDGLTAPIEKGQILGELRLLYHGQEYASVSLVAAKPIELVRVEYLKRLIKSTAGSAGIFIMLAVMAVLIGCYLVYAFSYRAYRLNKKSRIAARKKQLREERRAGARAENRGMRTGNTRKLSPVQGADTETEKGETP